jgi:hypothetical protein
MLKRAGCSLDDSRRMTCDLDDFYQDCRFGLETGRDHRVVMGILQNSSDPDTVRSQRRVFEESPTTTAGGQQRQHSVLHRSRLWAEEKTRCPGPTGTGDLRKKGRLGESAQGVGWRTVEGGEMRSRAVASKAFHACADHAELISRAAVAGRWKKAF